MIKVAVFCVGLMASGTFGESHNGVDYFDERICTKNTGLWEFGIPYSSPFEILDVWLNEEFLHIRVQYLGGCAVHEFELRSRGEENVFREISALELVLEHNAKGDICESLSVQDLKFNMNNRRYRFSFQELQYMPIKVFNGSNGAESVVNK